MPHSDGRTLLADLGGGGGNREAYDLLEKHQPEVLRPILEIGRPR